MADNTMTLLELKGELHNWCEGAGNLPLGVPVKELLQIQYLTPQQEVWLRDYVARWDKACIAYEVAERIRAAAPALLEALQGIYIYECDACGGSGIDDCVPPGESEGCGTCLGEGELISGLFPREVRAVIAQATGE